MPEASPPFPRHVLITGAGGGLGVALASLYAAKGRTMSLWGRDTARLERAEQACLRRESSVIITSHDLRDRENMRLRLLELDERLPVDLAFLNAGVSSGILPDGRMESPEDALRVMEVNAASSIYAAAILLERMRARGGGRVILTSSLAALSPLPSSPAYCASKAALLSYGRAMNMALAGTGVRICVICPGYVDTPMSRRLAGAKPWVWSAEKTAAHIRKRLESGKDVIAFPWLLALGTRGLNLLPTPLAAFFARRFSFTVRPDAESPDSSQGDGP